MRHYPGGGCRPGECEGGVRPLAPEVLQAARAPAQLPRELRALWGEGEGDEARQPLRLHRKDFYARVQSEAGLGSEREARMVTGAVFAALQAQLSPGEADDIHTQLPKDLKVVWEDA